MANAPVAVPINEGHEHLDADQLLRQIHTCAPVITENVMEAMERHASSKDNGVVRRLGLAVAAKDGAWYERLSTTAPQDEAIAMLESAQALHDYISTTMDLVDWLRKAEMRLSVALLARDDYEAVAEAAAAGQANG